MSNSKKAASSIEELERLALEAGVDISDELKKISDKIAETTNSAKAWQRVELARNPDRPRALDIIANICDDFIELHGDRYFGDDPALIGGLGFINGIAVTIIANQKGRNLKETMARNGGMANPEGYRKALRLAKQAEKFHRPIITLIDTQGAFPGLGAEERGIGEAKAAQIKAALLTSPVSGTAGITVYCRQGEVVLAGVLPRRAPAGFAAVRIARDTSGVRRVETFYVDGQPDAVGDFALKTQIKTSLISDPRLTSGQVDVGVYAGHVVLVGVVDSWQRVEDFREDVRSVPGVLSVRSYVQVGTL